MLCRQWYYVTVNSNQYGGSDPRWRLYDLGDDLTPRMTWPAYSTPSRTLLSRLVSRCIKLSIMHEWVYSFELTKMVAQLQDGCCIILVIAQHAIGSLLCSIKKLSLSSSTYVVTHLATGGVGSITMYKGSFGVRRGCWTFESL